MNPRISRSRSRKASFAWFITAAGGRTLSCGSKCWLLTMQRIMT